MRTERSGRDGPGPSLRGGSSSSRGRSSFNERDGRPVVMNNQVRFYPLAHSSNESYQPLRF